MNLYLVQHAEAKREEEDPRRPLSDRGWTDIRKVATFVAPRGGIQVRRILHSGKTRARQTAEVLAQYLRPAEGIQETDALEPLANPSTWAQRLAEATEDTMLVGHLPHLSKLASLLLCQDETKRIVDFQMGGIVCLSRDEAGSWFVRWMVIPQILD